ncbi:MAG UNVERIFIED_CONTAM: hypothetical protein LVR18_23290 [Planctomycetaceae bacterium]|jgi:hypothetical protein
MAISWRKDPPLSSVTALLDTGTMDARIGACQALEKLRGDAAPAVPQLRGILRQDDLWLRIRAASGAGCDWKAGCLRTARTSGADFPGTSAH